MCSQECLWAIRAILMCVNMAVPVSGCPLGLQQLRRKEKKIHKEPVFPKRNVLEGTITSAQKKKKKFVWNFLLCCFVHCPHLKKCYKTGSHWQTKSPRQRVKETRWVGFNRDKVKATLARAYSLFYKNSGIEITWLSPNIDILIHFCI